MLSKSRDRPWSAGHGDAHSTVRLPAAGKKGAHSGFPVESSFKGWSTECARNKRSYGKLCYDWKCTTATAKAQRSYGDGD